MDNVKSLINTSVDDARQSLQCMLNRDPQALLCRHSNLKSGPRHRLQYFLRGVLR